MTRLKILLRHNSIFPMIIAFVIGLYILITYGNAYTWILILLGIPLQMLNEYSLHRHIFHLPPPKEQWKFNLLYMAHYGHHDFPTNERLFFAPVWVVLPILVINFSICYGVASLLMPDHALAISAAIILVGGVGTFLSYEWFHMTAHLPVKKTKVEQHVTLLHAQHHFRNFTKWFHVSPGGEVIDRIMGTAIDREELKSQQREEFMTTLGLKPNDPRLISAREKYAPKYKLTDEEVILAGKKPSAATTKG